jgi:hypothetical protein
MFSHYAKGADWWGTGSTWNLLDLMGTLNFTQLMDVAPAKESIRFMENYFAKNTLEGKRKRFPAVFSIYFSGLDHYAHMNGMENYSTFFKVTTDAQIRDFLATLKQQGEYDNKIFIIVSDHGHTAMPTNLLYTKTLTTVDEEGKEYTREVEAAAEMSCELKLDFQIDPSNPEEGKNKGRAELANNNLHIWELAEILKLMPTGEITTDGRKKYHKVLSPAEIEKANKGETATPNAEQAEIVAALNGPMAHLYIKGEKGWKDDPKRDLLIKFADLLQAALVEGEGPMPNLGSSVEAILIRFSKDAEYLVYNGAAYDSGGGIALSEPIPIATYFADSQKYVSAISRIKKMTNPDRTGDIVLIMKTRVENPESDRYSTGVSCKSWHGSLNRSDSYVPFIVAYPGGNGNEIASIAEKVCLNDLCKGNWGTKELIIKMIEMQYSKE